MNINRPNDVNLPEPKKFTVSEFVERISKAQDSMIEANPLLFGSDNREVESYDLIPLKVILCELRNENKIDNSELNKMLSSLN